MRLKPVEGATATHGCGSKLTAYDTCIVFVSSSLGERDVEWCVAVVDACPSATGRRALSVDKRGQMLRLSQV